MEFLRKNTFFVALGKDAITLNEKLNLKRICMKEGMCKVGFSIKSTEKYIKILEEKELSFVFYEINDNTNEPEEIYRHIGKICDETRNSLNCLECSSRKETEKDILERIRNLGK